MTQPLTANDAERLVSAFKNLGRAREDAAALDAIVKQGRPEERVCAVINGIEYRFFVPWRLLKDQADANVETLVAKVRDLGGKV